MLSCCDDFIFGLVSTGMSNTIWRSLITNLHFCEIFAVMILLIAISVHTWRITGLARCSAGNNCLPRLDKLLSCNVVLNVQPFSCHANVSVVSAVVYGSCDSN